MSKVRMYCTAVCPYCVRAMNLLQNKGVAVEKIRVDLDEHQWQVMREITGRNTVPQIFIDDLHVGGYDELARLEMAGKLDALLKNPQ